MLGPWLPTITGWLTDDLTAPVKQRHTGRRVWQRLVEGHGAIVSESAVTHAVGKIRRELTGGTSKVAVPQTHVAGEEAEVDFGEFWAVIAGIKIKLWMFVMRLSFSGRAVHVAYANQAQESFLHGHAIAFERFGGVPSGMIRYDNLTPAVIRVMLGRDRLENPRFIAMRSHYGFDSFFCIPGIEGAHEKGGVEGEIGRFRRRWLTPVPEFASLAELNEHLAASDAKDDGRVIGHKPATVAADFAQEVTVLHPLPGDRFDAAATLSFKADHKAQVCVRQSYYSVPARHAGRRVSVRVGARRIEMFADRGEDRVARARGAQVLLRARVGPLPGGPHPQTRRPGRGDRAGDRSGVGSVHGHASTVLGQGPRQSGRCGRDEGVDRGAAAGADPPGRGDRARDGSGTGNRGL